MSKLPAFQFYPGDWLKDPLLRCVSSAARGLWIDMLCLMHESGRRGYLQFETGDPMLPVHIARMTGVEHDEVTGLIAELRTSGVLSCTEHGTIYSRRMARDESKRVKCQNAGKRGGNPTLRNNSENGATLKGASKGAIKGSPKGDSKGDSNRKPTPSSSSSVSSSEYSPPVVPPGGGVSSKSASSGKQNSTGDEEWLASLQKSEAYHRLDVIAEFAKMANWCQVNGKIPSRKRFINWLNRAEKPMEVKNAAQHRSGTHSHRVANAKYDRAAEKIPDY